MHTQSHAPRAPQRAHTPALAHALRTLTHTPAPAPPVYVHTDVRALDGGSADTQTHPHGQRTRPRKTGTSAVRRAHRTWTARAWQGRA